MWCKNDKLNMILPTEVEVTFSIRKRVVSEDNEDGSFLPESGGRVSGTEVSAGG